MVKKDVYKKTDKSQVLRPFRQMEKADRFVKHVTVHVCPTKQPKQEKAFILFSFSLSVKKFIQVQVGLLAIFSIVALPLMKLIIFSH